MTKEEFDELKRDDAVRIIFGGSGATQFAVVHSWSLGGYCRVMKYSETAGIWKGPLRVAAEQVIRLADAEDRTRTRPAREELPLGRGYVRNPLRPRAMTAQCESAARS